MKYILQVNNNLNKPGSLINIIRAINYNKCVFGNYLQRTNEIAIKLIRQRNEKKY